MRDKISGVFFILVAIGTILVAIMLILSIFKYEEPGIISVAKGIAIFQLVTVCWLSIQFTKIFLSNKTVE